MKISKTNLLILNKVWALAQDLERNSKDGAFDDGKLLELCSLLKALDSGDSQDLQKLSEIPEHLFPGMNLRHFQNFIIPIERLLAKSVRDDDFLVTHFDEREDLSKIQKAPLYFILENIRSTFNVGSIFRLADCVGASEVLLVGYTAGPEHETLRKTSMGAWELTPYQKFEKLEEALAYLESLKVQVVALETAANTGSLYDADLNRPTAFLVGNERFGLEAAALKKVHKVCHLPVYGLKNSLNVANALSIAAYEWRRQWK